MRSGGGGRDEGTKFVWRAGGRMMEERDDGGG